MGIKKMEQALANVEKYPTEPRYYNMMKANIDSIFQNFNWETMNKDDIDKALTIISKAVKRFYSLRTWQPTRRGGD